MSETELVAALQESGMLCTPEELTAECGKCDFGSLLPRQKGQGSANVKQVGEAVMPMEVRLHACDLMRSGHDPEDEDDAYIDAANRLGDMLVEGQCTPELL